MTTGDKAELLPLMKAAYKAVKIAIKSGVLVRPSTCENCGKIPPKTRDGRSGIQAHHPDYSKPLDVQWICAKCHRKETPFPAVMGAPNYGEKNAMSRLTRETVKEAKRLRETGLSYQKIADHLGVHKMTAMRAIKGVHWAAAPER